MEYNMGTICINIQHKVDAFITLYKINYSTMLIINNESTVYIINKIIRKLNLW